MNKKIILNNQEVEYELRRSRRASRLRLTVYGYNRVVVTLPWWSSTSLAEKLLLEKASWLIKKINYFKNRPEPILPRHSKAEYLKNKSAALKFIKERVEQLNGFYKFKYHNITIRNQKTRWGSCSRKGNLNFNYKILFLPEKIADYIIVHEICHLKEFNHSEKFWHLVALSIQDYLARRKELRHRKNCDFNV